MIVLMVLAAQVLEMTEVKKVSGVSIPVAVPAVQYWEEFSAKS